MDRDGPAGSTATTRWGTLRSLFVFFFFQAEDGIRDYKVTGVQTCALPIWRQLVEDRDVEVAVERQGERSRDRRGRHHEEVGVLALAAEPGALLDAEPVLLVHDGEAEAAELHTFLHERVRADDARDVPRGDPRPARGALARLERRGEQRPARRAARGAGGR